MQCSLHNAGGQHQKSLSCSYIQQLFMHTVVTAYCMMSKLLASREFILYSNTIKQRSVLSFRSEHFYRRNCGQQTTALRLRARAAPQHWYSWEQLWALLSNALISMAKRFQLSAKAHRCWLLKVSLLLSMIPCLGKRHPQTMLIVWSKLPGSGVSYSCDPGNISFSSVHHKLYFTIN